MPFEKIKKECKESPDGNHKPDWSNLEVETTDEMGGAQTIDEELGSEWTQLHFNCRFCGMQGTIDEEHLLADNAALPEGQKIIEWEIDD